MPDDELNRENPEGDELEQTKTRVAELDGLVAQKEEEISLANAHIAELEQAVTNLNNTLSQAVASYRASVIQANPGAIEELITGDTVDDINASLDRAKTLIGKVREGLEVEMVVAKVPAGAPQRTPIDLSALSPREKIQYAIGGKR